MSELAQQVHALEEDTQIGTITSILEGITLGTCVKLVKHLEEKWDISATPGGGGVMPGLLPTEVAEEVEQTEFSVVLKGVGNQKIGEIKAIRSLTMMDLKASKALTETLPALVKEKLPKDEADRFKAQLEEAGAEVELK